MDDRTLEAAAIVAALMMARMTQLQFRHDPDASRVSLANYLHAPAANLLLVPMVSDPAPGLLEEAVTTLDADALVVRAAGRDARGISFGVTLRGVPRPFHTAPLRLWLGAGAAAHLVPDDPADGVIALLRVGLRPCEVVPWDGEDDRQAGLALGLSELARALEGR